MKHLLVLFLFLTSSLSLFGDYRAAQFARVQSSLKPAVEKMLRYPKAQRLLQEAQREGPISVRSRPFHVSTSNAMWNAGNRTITLNSNHPRNEGEAIRSMIFELHNAKNNKRLHAVDLQARSGSLSKEAYVRNIEWVEHQNALEAKHLLDEGVNLGYYPSSSRWPIIENFEEHYRLQQSAGHSQFIAGIYDQISPHRNYYY